MSENPEGELLFLSQLGFMLIINNKEKQGIKLKQTNYGALGLEHVFD